MLTYRKPAKDSILASSFVTAWNNAGSPQFEIESFPLPQADADALSQQAALGNFMRSDHVALWYDNIPAIFISDSGLYMTVNKGKVGRDKYGYFMMKNEGVYF